jgi:hypothetical protein
MTEAQTTALLYHCRLATETIHPRFRYRLGRYGILLTVNSGYE